MTRISVQVALSDAQRQRLVAASGDCSFVWDGSFKGCDVAFGNPEPEDIASADAPVDILPSPCIVIFGELFHRKVVHCAVTHPHHQCGGHYQRWENRHNRRHFPSKLPDNG